MLLSDIEVLEGEAPTDERTVAQAMQRAINAGTAWSFQGSYGRAMMDAITAGDAMLGKNPARDAYGNYIPSRDEVKPGTRGSAAYVEAKRGADWVRMLEAA